MALLKMKPTSPGSRFAVKVDKSHLWKGDPYAPLTERQAKTGGRNNFGRITTRHKGGGSRQKYRIIDLKRDKDGVKGVVERIGRRNPLGCRLADQGGQRHAAASHPCRFDGA
jgi:large subunit ribosomal protein L2